LDNALLAKDEGSLPNQQFGCLENPRPIVTESTFRTKVIGYQGFFSIRQLIFSSLSLASQPAIGPFRPSAETSNSADLLSQIEAKPVTGCMWGQLKAISNKIGPT
jgi:hypothetical protein